MTAEDLRRIKKLVEEKCLSQTLFAEVEQRVKSILKTNFFKSFSRDFRM